ncbi:hypothetical protein F5X99DRAFT_321868 [Biscogniauxia marginata]|nr:hypothetical protein F5X99DRAFT_321868 [Biscogniauxia marginata]
MPFTRRSKTRPPRPFYPPSLPLPDILDLDREDYPALLCRPRALVSRTDSRVSDLATAARVFREATRNCVEPKIATGVNFYIAAESMLEQPAAEEPGDWEVLLDAWDVRRSRVTITEGEGGPPWSQKVGELPPNM